VTAGSDRPAIPEPAPWRKGGHGRSTIAFHYVERGRVISCVTLPVVTILLLTAIHGQWLQAQYVSDSPAETQVQIQYVIITVYAGGAVSCSSYSDFPGFNPCRNVSQQLTGTQADLYGGLNDALIAIAGLGAFASALALLGNFGIRFGRAHLTAVIALVFLLAGVIGGLVVAVPLAGTGPQIGAFCWLFSGNVTTCPGFWGSSVAFPMINGTCLSCDDHLVWGAGFGYYQTAFALGLAILTAWLLWSRRRRPFTIAEQMAWKAGQRVAGGSQSLPANRPGLTPSAPGPARGPSVYPPEGGTWTRPPLEATHPGFRIGEGPWTCPNCQTSNSRWAVICQACHSDRPRQ